jgi:hypothetical protein
VRKGKEEGERRWGARKGNKGNKARMKRVRN